MKRALTALALIAIAGLAVASPVGAGGGAPEFLYSPASGPAGTTITASGNCETDFGLTEESDASVDAPLAVFWLATLTLSDDSGVLDMAQGDATGDGSWELQVTVPEGTEAGDLDLDASCEIPVAEPAAAYGGRILPYATQIFSVTQAPTTVTEADLDPATTPAVAAEAEARQAQPAFTG